MRSVIGVLLISASFALTASASPLGSADPSASTLGAPGGNFLTIMPRERFAVDLRLHKNVEFWVSIYTRYTTQQGLIHDAKYIDKIYEVMDVGPGEKGVRAAKRKWRDVLLSLHRKSRGGFKNLTPEEQKVYDLYADIQEPNKFLAAAHRKRLRFQLGQKDRFLDGYVQSGRYLSIMEEIFRREGLPLELTRLPFVESSFNVRARSKVGASGIWQFMRSTGRLFLTINDAVDERNDPIRATEAAAKLLKMNFDSLRAWPLAVTAYNHGRKGMMRAVRKVGSDELEDVVDSYRGRSFGFASSNFFTELLAAIEVERNAEKYFGKVAREKPLPYVEAKIPDYIDIREISHFLKLDLAQLRAMNPGLTESVYNGARLVPAGYQLRLPWDGTLQRDAALRLFLAGYSQIPDIYKLRAQRRARYGRRVMSTQ